MHNQTLWAALLTALLFISGTATANTPGEFPFQGRLTDALGNPLDTTVNITFHVGSIITVKDGQDVHVGDVLARIPQESTRTRCKATLPLHRACGGTD